MSDYINATITDDGFGMELHAEYIFMLMLHGHHYLVVGPCRNLEGVGNIISRP